MRFCKFFASAILGTRIPFLLYLWNIASRSTLWKADRELYILAGRIIWYGESKNIRKERWNDLHQNIERAKLVYYEYTNYIYNTIAHEKQLKHLLRKEKEELIRFINPHWKDLYGELVRT